MGHRVPRRRRRSMRGIVSEPALGDSMALPVTDAEVWPALMTTVEELAPRCRAFAIACNTLNVYADRIHALQPHAELMAFQDVVATWADDRGLDRVGLLGARPVTALREWSPYALLAGKVKIITPTDPEPLHRLIEDIKVDGGADPAHGERLTKIIADLKVQHVLLACTELPLVVQPVNNVELIDVTMLVADALVARVSDI